jgi:predicted esterase
MKRTKCFAAPFGSVAIVFLLLVPSLCAAAPAYSMPASVNPTAKYLFYFHNYYVEMKGTEGECKYYDILKAFSDRNFVVISEVRSKYTSVIAYANKAAENVRTLLESGVPQENITIAGHSKGAVIALQLASMLDKPKINYVILAGCGIKGLEKSYPDFGRIKGNVLSVYAASDDIAGSCNAAMARTGQDAASKEITLQSPAGHQLFFQPTDIWIEPVIAWLKQPK